MIKVSQKIESIDSTLSEIPRFGMKFSVPGSFNNVSWFGRGPHESYWDRKSSAAINYYSGPIWEQSFQYVRPQETGNKTDVYWMAISNDKNGLIAIGLPQFDGSVHHYPYSDLDYYPGTRRHGKIDYRKRIKWIGLLIISKWVLVAITAGGQNLMKNIHYIQKTMNFLLCSHLTLVQMILRNFQN